MIGIEYWSQLNHVLLLIFFFLLFFFIRQRHCRSMSICCPYMYDMMCGGVRFAVELSHRWLPNKNITHLMINWANWGASELPDNNNKKKEEKKNTKKRSIGNEMKNDKSTCVCGFSIRNSRHEQRPMCDERMFGMCVCMSYICVPHDLSIQRDNHGEKWNGMARCMRSSTAISN